MCPSDRGSAAVAGEAMPKSAGGSGDRRSRLEAALASAKPAAEREAWALLDLLKSPGASSGAIEERAHAALRAVGLLWEAAARANRL